MPIIAKFKVNLNWSFQGNHRARQRVQSCGGHLNDTLLRTNKSQFTLIR